MKTLILIVFILTSITAFSQSDISEEEPWQKVLSFDKLKRYGGNSSNYETAYMRYCFKKSSNLRITSYCLSAVTAIAFYAHNSYTEEVFLQKYSSKYLDAYNQRSKALQVTAYSLTLASVATYIASEVWFRKSTVVPIVSGSGIGIIIRH